MARRLPGVRFEAAPPPAADVLPRMDVAAFVGFASSGPLDVPVPVEDAVQFEAIFGPDAPLAWDAERGEHVYANLGPAVRSFFRNGGRRCYVVRVADAGAVADGFELPGVVQVTAEGLVRHATMRARSPGSWADDLRVGAAVTATPIRATALALVRPRLEAYLADPADLKVGDAVRIRFPGSSWTLVFGIVALGERTYTLRPSRFGSRLRGVHATGGHSVWIRAAARREGESGRAFWIDAAGGEAQAPATVSEAEEGRLRVTIRARPATAPSEHALVRLRLGRDDVWLESSDIRPASAGPAEADRVSVAGRAFEVTRRAPRPLPEQEAQGVVERLELELLVARGEGTPARLAALGLARDHPRFFAELPTDELLYRALAQPDPVRDLFRAAAEPRFPLAGPEGTPPRLLLPVGSLVPGGYLPARVRSRSAQSRNGLSRFTAAPFLDPDLDDRPVRVLMEEADFIRWQSSHPRALRGIHALLHLDEVTLVAVPDAVNRAWRAAAPEEPSELVPPGVSALLSKPASVEVVGPDCDTIVVSWQAVDDAEEYELQEAGDPEFASAVTVYRGPRRSARLPGRPAGVRHRVRALAGGRAGPWAATPPWPGFGDCDARLLDPPARVEVRGPEGGALVVAWDAVEGADGYELQEALDADFRTATTVYRGASLSHQLFGRPVGGARYYRVRAFARRSEGAWAFATAWEEPPWRVATVPRARYADTTLLRIQRALLRMCAARGDLFALLALPEHYREDAAIGHVRALRSLRIGGGDLEEIALDYGAVHHPWLVAPVEQRPGAFRRIAPDGAAAGIMAARTTRRGAWIAPANEPLRDVVALEPPIAPERYGSLQEAQVNLVRQEPEGFLWLSADTLSRQEDVRPINVRRLLQLVRRAALLHGPTYVFEPNDDVLRRAAERGFEALLTRLFLAGAFAGRTPEQSFQVSAGSPPNTRQSIDQGRFIVELKVAPSRPLAFLGVRLIRSGDGALQVEAA